MTEANTLLPCVQHPDWFDGVDMEDSKGNLIGYNFPYERQAKALCATCPVFDWCKAEWGNAGMEGVILAGATDIERRRKAWRLSFVVAAS